MKTEYKAHVWRTREGSDSRYFFKWDVYESGVHVDGGAADTRRGAWRLVRKAIRKHERGHHDEWRVLYGKER